MKRSFRDLLASFLLLGFLVACRTSIPVTTSGAGFPRATIASADAVIETAIDEGRIVGGVLWIERNGVSYHRAYGRRAVVPHEEQMTEETIFDMASLTKVMATTPSIMQLVESGRVAIDEPVRTYLPEFRGDRRDEITVRQLLTHTSGLRPDVTLTDPWSGRDEGMRRALVEVPTTKPGTAFRYSDINFLLLGEIVERVSGQPLEEYSLSHVFRPLGMNDTGFRPPLRDVSRVAPTEQTEEGMLRGVVHDPTARRMGGVAGHAGLFSTISDVARYARMLLGRGSLDGARILKPETVDLMTSIQSPPGVPELRALGWDIDTHFSRPRGGFPFGTFGHTGFTGTMLWVDPGSNAFYAFLSNRVHPDGKGSVIRLQKELGTAAAKVVGIDPALAVPVAGSPTVGAAALNGIDVLEAEDFYPLRGLRIGLITNQTGKDRTGRSTIDVLREAPAVHLRALFTPEHGIRGDVEKDISDGIDSSTGLPIYSLYGERRKPSADQLNDLDALVFDIQDIGARFYTYISTMGLAMEAAAEAGIRFIVLDRINPVNGVDVEGPSVLDETSFVAFHPIAIRHGMTVGELARMFRAERKIDVALSVVELRNWERAEWQDQTALPWVNTSPNIRSLTAATLYPGVGLLETSSISVGRGTDRPFEQIGAPYVDGVALARELNARAPSCVRFKAIEFTPVSSVYENQHLGGVSIRLVHRDGCPIVEVGITMATVLQRLYPAELHLERINRLVRSPSTLDAIRLGVAPEEIRSQWAEETRRFLERRARFLLYD